jgi:hypothetical protein
VKAARWADPAFQRAHQRANTGWLYTQTLAPQRRLTIRILEQVLPQYWEALLDGEIVEISTRPGPGLVALPDDLARELRNTPPTLEDRRVLPFVNPEQELRRLDGVESELRSQWVSASEIRLRVELDIDWRNSHVSAALHVHPMAMATGGRTSGPHVEASFAISGTSQEWDNGLPPQVRYPEFVPDEWKVDALLGKTRTLSASPPANRWLWRNPNSPPPPVTRDLLPAIAATWDLEVVADAYPGPDESRFTGPRDWPMEEESPLYRVLNRRALNMSHWTREGDVLHLRRRHWYRVRPGHIPVREARQWEERLRQNPELTLPLAANVVHAFRDDQLAEFAPTMRERGVWLGDVFDRNIANVEGDAPGARELLRAFGSLPLAQQNLLLSGGHLPGETLAPEAHRWLRRALRKRRGGLSKEILPPTLAGGVLGLAFHPVRRVVIPPREGGYLIDYRVDELPETVERPISHRDHVRPAPELSPPREGSAQVVVFEFRWPDGRKAQFQIILPWVAVIPELPAAEECGGGGDGH